MADSPDLGRPADSLRVCSLEGVDPEVLTEAFNQAFADYVIHFQATREFKESRWKLARVDWALSVGVFDADRLVAFCYHGIDEVDGVPVAYNSGTGVLPGYRGRRLVDRIYEETWPRLRERGVRRCTLEVIAGNDRALRVYERIGFKIQRELVYLKGELDREALRARAAEVELRELLEPPWEQLESWQRVQPAWDFMLEGARVQGDAVRVVGAFEGGSPVGAAILREPDQTLCWLSVSGAHRRRGIGSALLLHAAKASPTWRMVNVDRRGLDLIEFLHIAGLEEELFQYEMAATMPAE